MYLATVHNTESTVHDNRLLNGLNAATYLRYNQLIKSIIYETPSHLNSEIDIYQYYDSVCNSDLLKRFFGAYHGIGCKSESTVHDNNATVHDI